MPEFFSVLCNYDDNLITLSNGSSTLWTFEAGSMLSFLVCRKSLGFSKQDMAVHYWPGRQPTNNHAINSWNKKSLFFVSVTVKKPKQFFFPKTEINFMPVNLLNSFNKNRMSWLDWQVMREHWDFQLLWKFVSRMKGSKRKI